MREPVIGAFKSENKQPLVIEGKVQAIVDEYQYFILEDKVNTRGDSYTVIRLVDDVFRKLVGRRVKVTIEEAV